MKKTLIMTIIIALMLSIASVVNAATLSTNSSKVTNEESVVVTINLGDEMTSGDFTLAYDNKVFEFVDASSDTKTPLDLTDVSTGKRIMFYQGTAKVITVTLKPIVESADSSSISFVPTMFSDLDYNEVALDEKSTAVTIEKKVEPTPSEAPAETPSTTPSEKPTTTPSAKPATYAKTGANYVAISMGLVILVVAGIVTIKKCQK